MYLKELTISGFKSFAKKGELEFSAPITAIVGPNGSGKSNVAESFRFVLGEQSVKAMRGKKGEDLIWGGSEKVSRGNRASVELVFDNHKRTFALDFDEVKIERVVHRDGQNEYKVNGSAVRLKDVHELLAGANIGSTGHHIISQGEADRVLSATAKERREMIEDALGLKVYQLKKNEAERKLQKTLANIEQVESLRREAAPHLRYLKKQVERAERAIATKRELSTVYAEYLKREDTYVAFHTDRLESSLITPKARLEEVNEELAKVKELLINAEDTAVREAVRQAEESFNTLSRNRQQAEQALSAVVAQIQLLERRVEKAQKDTGGEETQGVIAKQDLKTVIEKNRQLLDEADTADAHVLKNLFRSFLKAVEELLRTTATTPVDTSSEDVALLKRLEDERKTLETNVQEALSAEEAGFKKVQTAKATVEEATVKNQEAERTLFSLREEQRKLETNIRDMEQALVVLERDREDFKRELQEAVTLLGREASNYFTYEIVENETTLKTEDIVAEDRTKQRDRQRALEKLKIRLEELGVGSTTELLKEYEEAKQRDEFLSHELSDLSDSVANLRALIADLQEQLREQFLAGIEKISVEFNRFFTLMFGGGSAELAVVQVKTRSEEDVDDEGDTEVQVEEGVELKVSLPNKRVKGLNMLSGGERALVSIAVIFAMSQVNPPPFIILDETDAALDEANSRRYGDMIEELAKRSQLVLITHNRETMSRAGILYGITMGADGVSKLLSVKFDEATAVAK
jgi:chromosome segregation protein